jgi:thiamine biosynthesis lipoprotein
MRTRFICVFLLCGGIVWHVAASKSPNKESYFHHDHILGTSLDVCLAGLDPAGVDEAELTLLGEIERLRRIFSLYDETSELSRLNRTREPLPVSPELIDVLRLYEVWQERSNGAFNGQLGELVRIWKEAEKTQLEPDAKALSRIVEDLRRPGWRIEADRVTRLTDQPLNLNAIGKGYIIQSAARAVLKAQPGLKGLLLNLGGDLFVWGHDSEGRDWTIGVQDPAQPQENAEPIAEYRIHDRAVATSGGYERYYTIQGTRHSHLFDPRTGRSANGVLSATAIASDNATANALATTLCILAPEDGLKLVARTPGAECLIVAKDGTQHRSPGMKALLAKPRGEVSRALGLETVVLQDDKAAAWPADFQVNLTVTIPESYDNPRFRKPYLAIWMENADAKPVRTLAVWGKDSRWLKELPQWWKFAKSDGPLVKAVTRPTRSPGKYTLVWDGKDDKNAPLPQGTYTIHVEVHREHGKLVRQSGKLVCQGEPATITLPKNAEAGDTLIEYAKKKAP